MRSFGFDYFVGRAEVLTEMARTVSIFGFEPKFNQLYGQLLKNQQALGVEPSRSRQLIVFRFIIDAINQFVEIYQTDNGELMTSKEIVKELTGKTDVDVSGRVAIDMAKNNINILKNPEFINYVSNPENMEIFKTHASLNDDYSTVNPELGDKPASSRRFGKHNKLKEIVGVGLSEYEKSTIGAKDLVMKMNKMVADRKKMKSSNPKLQAKSSSHSVDDPNISFAKDLVDSINSVLKNQQTYKEYLDQYKGYLEKRNNIKSKLNNIGKSNYDEEHPLKPLKLSDKERNLAESSASMGDLNYLKSMYEKTIKLGTGANFEEFDKFITKLKTFNGMTPDRFSVFADIYDELDKLDESADDDFGGYTVQDISGKHGSSPYPEYPSDIVSEVLDTPEKRKVVDDWYHNYKKWRSELNDRLYEKLEQKYIDLQMKINPKLQGANNNELFINPAIQQYMTSLQGYEKMLAKLDDLESDLKFTHKREHLEGKIKQLQDKITQIRQNKNNPPPEEEEEDIMNTFVESLQSKYYKPKGQFVDRGFKKYSNYAQWLMNND